MSKFSTLASIAATAAAMFCSVSCKEKEQPRPELTVQDRIEVPSEGGSFSIAYEIANPDESLKLEASSADSWITSVDCATSGTITFSVDEYKETEASREGSIDIVYGDITKSVAVVQAPGPVYFSISVSDIDYTSFKVSVIPFDKEMTYAALVTTREFFDGFDTVQALIDNVFASWKEDAEDYNMSLEDYLAEVLMKGDTEGMTTTDRYPGKEYAVFAFGINTGTMEVLTDLYSTLVTTKKAEMLDVTYSVRADVDGANANIHVEPSDMQQTYYVDVIAADKLSEASTVEYWQQLFIDNIRINRLLYGLTAEEVMAPNIHTGVSDTMFELSPNTEYAAVAMASSPQGVVFSEVNTVKFTTEDAKESDNVIKITVDIISSTKYNMTITPSNDDPYTWGTQPTSTYEGMTDEEMLEYLLQDPFIGFNLVTGEISYEFGASPGDEYTVYAFGYQNGVATTDLARYEFKMPDEDPAASAAAAVEPEQITVLRRN